MDGFNGWVKYHFNPSIKNFDPSLEIIVLKETARTAQDAANGLKCEVGAIIKSLVLRTDDSFLLCLISDQKFEIQYN